MVVFCGTAWHYFALCGIPSTHVDHARIVSICQYSVTSHNFPIMVGLSHLESIVRFFRVGSSRLLHWEALLSATSSSSETRALWTLKVPCLRHVLPSFHCFLCKILAGQGLKADPFWGESLSHEMLHCSTAPPRRVA